MVITQPSNLNTGLFSPVFKCHFGPFANRTNLTIWRLVQYSDGYCMWNFTFHEVTHRKNTQKSKSSIISRNPCPQNYAEICTLLKINGKRCRTLRKYAWMPKNTESTSHLKFSFRIIFLHLIASGKYSGDLNTRLFRYSNSQKLSDHRLVRYSNAIWIQD